MCAVCSHLDNSSFFHDEREDRTERGKPCAGKPRLLKPPTPPKKDTRTVKFNSDGRSRLMQGLSHRITCHACKSTGPKFVLLGKTSTPRSDQFNSLALSSWETLINRILLMTRTHYQSVSVHLNTQTSHRGR